MRDFRTGVLGCFGERGRVPLYAARYYTALAGRHAAHWFGAVTPSLVPTNPAAGDDERLAPAKDDRSAARLWVAGRASIPIYIFFGG